MASVANLADVPLGRTAKVIQTNTSTGQRIISRFSLYNREQSKYGGAWVWKVVGSYHKIYYGPCLSGRMAADGIGLTSVIEFE
jgi:hypothetical protein